MLGLLAVEEETHLLTPDDVLPPENTVKEPAFTPINRGHSLSRRSRWVGRVGVVLVHVEALYGRLRWQSLGDQTVNFVRLQKGCPDAAGPSRLPSIMIISAVYTRRRKPKDPMSSFLSPVH
jgi:hypothetical protein